MISSGRGRLSGAAALLIVGMICSQTRVGAEAVGSPSSILKKKQWAMGLRGGSLLNRGLDNGAEASVYRLGHVRGYGLTDWLSLYGTIGWAHVAIEDASIIKRNDPSTDNSFGHNVLANAQLKGKLWQHLRTGLEWDGSMQFAYLGGRHKGKNEVRWNEWQLSTSLAKPIGRVTPYVGVKLSLIHAKTWVRQDGEVVRQLTYRQDGLIGPFIGSDIHFGTDEHAVINVEGSYLDGAEVDVAVSYLF